MQFIVAVDGSEQSDRALDHAVEMAARTGAELTAVHVVDPAVYERAGVGPVEDWSDADRGLVLESITDAEERGARILDEAVERAAGSDVALSTELLYGDPATGIVDYADEAAADAVFVGHRGLSDRAEGFLGSVAHAVVGRATVPVTVVS